MELTIEVKKNEEETAAGAKVVIAAHFTALKKKRGKVVEAAKAVFEKNSGKRMGMKDLIGSIRFLTDYEVDEEVIGEILKNEGFEGVGQKGRGGIGLPGDTASHQAAATPAKNGGISAKA